MPDINFKEIEERTRKFWENEKIYKFNPKSKKKIYSVDTPPPTVSGEMHIGHACSYSQQDFLIRYKRMKGLEIFYPFGTDDNGLPTERLVEKKKNVKAIRKSY
jgi:valyl-tRNA synthetase